jgi:hypothetical protein
MSAGDVVTMVCNGLEDDYLGRLFWPARIGLTHYELTHWLYNPMMHIMRVQRRYKKP